MVKLGISGKANSGKNTISNLIMDLLKKDLPNQKTIAFADPIKKIAQTMFPQIKDSDLYGASKNRSKIISGGAKDSDNNELTIRRLLLDVGTSVGRQYKDSIWLDVFDNKVESLKDSLDLVVVTDCRFRNEFDHLKNKNFFMIRVKRDNSSSINHSSETGQDAILDSEFDFIIDNNSSLDDLKARVTEVCNIIKEKSSDV